MQRAELFDYKEPQDDDGQAGIQEVLPPLPQAHAAQGSEIDLGIENFCDLVIEEPLRRSKLPNHSMTKLLNQIQGRKLNG